VTTEVDEEAPPDGDTEEAPRLEDTRRGRTALTAFILLVLVLLFAANMPVSIAKDRLLAVAQPVLNAAGLDQGWGVFSPNPPRETSLVYARIDHIDGTAAIRGIPYTSGISEYWNYRWSKLGEQLQRNDRLPERIAFARWMADRDREAGGRPVRVTLVRQVRFLPPPGQQPEFGPVRDEPVFALEIRS
jgi:hypothetical protein